MIKSLLDDDQNNPSEPTSGTESPLTGSDSADPFAPDPRWEEEPARQEEPFILSEAAPESFGETTRRSGLAWSVGIAFFASVIFMMVLGWGADLLFGTAPWGIAAGIILGALIGFIQLFRISSEIFRK